MKTLKEKVLQKCAELHNPAAPCINEYWELDKMRSKARYTLTKYNNGSLAKYVFDESVPDNDPVWPLAAQALGILPTDLNKFVNDLLYVVGNHFQFDLLTTVKRLVDKSPKPDWVKEEINAANDPFPKIKEEIGRILGYLEEIHEATTSTTRTKAHLALSCLANVEIYLGRPTNRPSDDLLWKAFSAGLMALSSGADESKTAPDAFSEFLQTIPPDTLKEDRELVRKSVLWDTGDIFEDQIELHMTAMAAPTIEVYEAIKRLCGLEVGGC